MRIGTATAGLLTALLLLPTPANAAQAVVEDADDINHGVDLLKVRVTHAKRVKVELTHVNLTRRQYGGISVFLDTDPSERGPEFVLGSGLYGSDYQLSRTDGWKAVGAPLACRYRLELDFVADKTHLRFGRGCLGKPQQVRVAVKVAGEKRDGTVLVDWMTERRAFTDWVAQG